MDNLPPRPMNQPGVTSPTAFCFTHFPHLDGFRGISILLVIFGHTAYYSLNLPEPFAKLGGLGVMLFFVLSGFLITGLLCREEQETGNTNLFQFYLRRSLRIFPASYFFLLITGILIANGCITDVPWTGFLACAFYVRNIFGRGDSLGHLWSLSLEEQFYFFWPISFKLSGSRRALILAGGAVVVITLWRSIAQILEIFPLASGAYYCRPEFRFDSILFGCFISLWLSNNGISNGFLKLVKLGNPLFTVPAAIGVTIWGDHLPGAAHLTLPLQMFLAGGLLAHLVVFPNSPFAVVLASKGLQQLGKLSYSLYLWQQIFIATKAPDWGLIRGFPFDILATIAAGCLSYYLIELPFLKVKDRLSKASKGQRNAHPDPSSPPKEA